jgi:hypothetical protein
MNEENFNILNRKQPLNNVLNKSTANIFLDIKAIGFSDYEINHPSIFIDKTKPFINF